MAYLAALPRGRWATARRRWLQTIMTATLILTGMTAWAAALVQPWATRTLDANLLPVPTCIDTDKLRTASADIERVLDEPEVMPSVAPRRNPFLAVRPGGPAREVAVKPAAASAMPTSKPVPSAPAAPSAPASESQGGVSAAQVLAAVRGLRLEVTVIAPSGEKWAVINGANYREGDIVAGLEIAEIQEGRVRLRQAGVVGLLRMD